MLPDEPLPVRLMSTIWADADGLHDDLRTTADVNEWLDAIGVDRAGAHATERELATARALRAAVRLLAAYVAADADRAGRPPRQPTSPPPSTRSTRPRRSSPPPASPCVTADSGWACPGAARR